MKTALKTITIIAALGISMIATAAEKSEFVGPKGGRILEKTEPKAEFFVEKDKSVTITFYDAAGRRVPAADENVTVIADAKAGKQKIEFERKGDVLVSKSKLPEGDGYNVVVQYKSTADARPQNFRFKYDASTCADCKRTEYACVCHD